VKPQAYENDTQKYVPRKTILLGTPSTSGEALTCRACHTTFFGGKHQHTYECPFCYREVRGHE
jgi:protein-arginine kinase activator protein McsA